jgi:cysteine-rich repeat protein
MGEACDGTDLGAHSCLEFGWGSPAGLACDSACQLDPSGCAPVCGNGVKEGSEGCDDGNVVQNDGCAGDCTIEGTTCVNAIPVSLDFATLTLEGSTVGGGAHSSEVCYENYNADTGGLDRIYAVTPLHDGFLTASLVRGGSADYDSTLHVRTDCGTFETTIVCANSQGAFGGEVLSIPVTAFSKRYVIVDGVTGASGDYELVLNLSTGTCADPVPVRIEPGDPMVFVGASGGQGDDSGGSCAGSGAPDVVYRVTPGAMGPLDITTFTATNASLYARTSCGDPLTELDCSDAVSGLGTESISLSGTADTPVYVWVDGASGESGTYQLTVQP